MLRLGNTDITRRQLFNLGAIYEAGQNRLVFYPHVTWSQSEFNNAIAKGQITISAKYWTSWLLATYKTTTSRQQLDWLLAAEKFLPFREDTPLIKNIKEGVKLLKYIITQDDPDNPFYHDWIEKIFKQKSIPWYFNNEEEVAQQVESYFIERNHPFKTASAIDLEAIQPNKSPEATLNYLELFESSKGIVLETILTNKEKIRIKRQLSIKKLPKTQSIRNIVSLPEHGKSLMGPGTVLSIWDGYNAGATLADPFRTDKADRDAKATFIFIGGELSTSFALINAAAYTNFFVGYLWWVASSSYSGSSLLYEYWNANLSHFERFNTFWRGFWQQDIHPRIKSYLEHKEIGDQLAKNYRSILNNQTDVYFIAGGIGQYNPTSFEAFITEQHGSDVLQEIQTIEHICRHKFFLKCKKEVVERYQQEYNAYLENNLLSPTSVSMVLGPRETKKLSRLTPTLPGDDVKFLCAPAFREMEAAETASFATHDWDCQNSFMLALAAKKNPLQPSTGVFDLSEASSGNITLTSKKVDFRSVFQLGNYSTVNITTARNNSPDSLFILPSEAFFGQLTGDPASRYISSTLATVDASKISEHITIQFNHEKLTYLETQTNKTLSEAVVQYINSFKGHHGQDIVDCTFMDIKSIDTLGGLLNAPDQLTDCKEAILSSHTTINNKSTDEAQYFIRANSENIIFYQEEKQQTVFLLSEPLISFLQHYHFHYSAEQNILYVNKIDSDASLLIIYNYKRPGSNISFIDTEKTSFTLQPMELIGIDKEESAVISNHLVYRMQIPDLKNPVSSTQAKHTIFLDQHPDLQFIGRFYDPSLPANDQIVLGNRGPGVFILDDLTYIKYVKGNDDSDRYKITEQALYFAKGNEHFRIEIDNYSSALPLHLDKLYLPFPQSEVICNRELNNLVVKFSRNSYITTAITFIIKNYFLSNHYQHLIFIDSEINYFIPFLSTDNNVDLIPYYSNQRSAEIVVDARHRPLRIAVEDTLSPFQAYRSWDQFYLISDSKDETNTTLFLNLPAEQIDPSLEIKLISTQQANLVTEKNDNVKLKLSDYLDHVRDDMAELQTLIDSSIEKYRYTFEALNSYSAAKTTPIITFNQERKDKKIGYIEFDKPPWDVKLTAIGKSLSLEIYTNQQSSTELTLYNWQDPRHRLQGIIIDDKLLPVPLAGYDCNAVNLEKATTALRFALLKHRIEDELVTLSPDSKLNALKILNLIFSNNPTLVDLIYKHLGFHHRLNSNRPILELQTPKLESDIAKALNLFCISLLLAEPNTFSSPFSSTFPQANYDLLFNNLDQNMQYNFRTIINEFKQHILNNTISEDIKLALKIRQAIRVVNYSIEPEEASFDNKPQIVFSSTLLNFHIKFSKEPAAIQLKCNNQDLLITVYNDKEDEQKRILLKIKDWGKTRAYSSGMLIADKPLPVALSELSCVPEHTEKFTLNLNLALLLTGMTNYPLESKNKAIVSILSYNNFSSQVCDYYSIFGFKSQEEVTRFIITDFHRLKSRMNYCTEEEAKVILSFYLSARIAYPENTETINNIFQFIPQSYYTPLLKDADIQNNFLTAIKNFKEKTLSDKLLQAICFAMRNEFIPQKSKRRDGSLSLLEEESKVSNAIRFTFVPNTHSIIHPNQAQKIQSGVETWITVPEEERKKFFLDLGSSNENRNQPTSVSITQENKDLIFTFIFDGYPDKNTTLLFKNYTHPEHRISGIIANNQTIFDKLEFLRIEDHASLEKIVNAALIKVQAQRQRSRNLRRPIEDEVILKAFLISKALAQPSRDLHALATAFGFNSPRALMKFYDTYLATYPEENRITDDTRAIFEDRGKRRFFKLLYLYVIEATESSLTVEQIQQTFPFLTKTLLADFVKTYRTVLHSNFNLEKKNLLKNKLFFTAHEEMDSAIEGTSIVPHILELSSGEAPYYYSGFREKAFLNLANIHYNKIRFLLRGNSLSIFLEDSTGESIKTAKVIVLTNWFDPFFQLYGLNDTNKDWEFEFPRNLYDLNDAVKTMQKSIDQKLLDSRVDSQEQLYDQAQPQVAENRVNIHLEETKAYQLVETENRTTQEERSLLQSAGKWLYEVVGVIGGGMAVYAVWILRRRYGMKGSYAAISTVEKVLEEVVTEAKPVEIPFTVGTETYSGEKGNPLLSFGTQDGERIEENFNREADSSVLGFPVQENLLLADFLVRNVTSEKYERYIGNYSLERQQTDYLNDLQKKVTPALTMTEEDWSSGYYAFEGLNYFAEKVDDDVDDTLFSIGNLFAQENDGLVKNTQKKILKARKKCSLAEL